MSVHDWICCPEGCDADTEVVLLPDGRIGFSCIGCGRKVVSPVRTVEPQYRTIAEP